MFDKKSTLLVIIACLVVPSGTGWSQHVDTITAHNQWMQGADMVKKGKIGLAHEAFQQSAESFARASMMDRALASDLRRADALLQLGKDSLARAILDQIHGKSAAAEKALLHKRLARRCSLPILAPRRKMGRWQQAGQIFGRA